MSSPPRGSAADQLGTPGNGIDHLPYGSVAVGAEPPKLAVRLGDTVVPVGSALRLTSVSDDARAAANSPNLDRLLASTKSVWDEVRDALQRLFRDPAASEAVITSSAPVSIVRVGLPFTVADYIDFYGNEFHATNVGKLFRPGMAPLTANWKHLPIGYHGRAGTIAVSGTDFRRPQGITLGSDGKPAFGASARLDIEAEVGFVLGAPAPGGHIPVADAAHHIFGLTLTNDWSARDIQAFEYVPLGPNLGKSFCTTISPWITPLAALDHARVSPPPRDTPLSAYLDDSQAEAWGFDLQIEIVLNGEVVSVAPFAQTYWTPAQMLAHMTVNGAGLRAGDFFAGGTVSGPNRHQRGSFLEISWDGTEPLILKDGGEFSFLRDGDEVVLRGSAPGPEATVITLGECRGRVLPAESS